MPRRQLGRYDAWATLSGLRVTGTVDGYSLRLDFNVQETMELLQLLMACREVLYQGLHHAQSPLVSPCPACGCVCSLQFTATGYYGACGNCGDDFELDVAGTLLRHHYGHAR